MDENPNRLPDKTEVDRELFEINQLLEQGTLPAGEAENISEEKTAVTEEKEEKTKSKGLGFELYGWLQAVVAALVIIVLVFVFVVRIIGVIGPSMEPTLFEGDRVLLFDATWTNVEIGDVIVVQQKSYSDSPIVKRVIAKGGQTVDIDFDAGIVYVDGEVSDFVDVPTTRRYDVTFPLVVEEGKLFVLGDNRNESIDSRYSPIGLIDERSVLGEVAMVVFPLSRFGERP
ncbi:MAG: signal peptidase I [Oscillospiraceae bacterium]|nr:signal peptidase I [Oscillospiraceae bacterium]